MTKAKTNALDALRTLIAERQQYEQWISALESRREGTPEHVFDRVKADYESRLQRVVADIHGHAEELQLSISTLSSRLVEVARDEDTRREGLQEAELRAAVGEYEPEQWDQLRSEAEKEIAKIASDRASLDAQLGELRAIQKLSEVGSVGSLPGTLLLEGGEQPVAVSAPGPQAAPTPSPAPAPAAVSPSQPAPSAPTRAAPSSAAASAPEQRRTTPPAAAPQVATPFAPVATAEPTPPAPHDQGKLPLDPVATAANAAASAPRPRSSRTPPGGVSSVRSRSEVVKPDNSKTLKCPECGTPNYPTEWYCERCGGELATM